MDKQTDAVWTAGFFRRRCIWQSLSVAANALCFYGYFTEQDMMENGKQSRDGVLPSAGLAPLNQLCRLQGWRHWFCWFASLSLCRADRKGLSFISWWWLSICMYPLLTLILAQARKKRQRHAWSIFPWSASSSCGGFQVRSTAFAGASCGVKVWTGSWPLLWQSYRRFAQSPEAAASLSWFGIRRIALKEPEDADEKNTRWFVPERYRAEHASWPVAAVFRDKVAKKSATSETAGKSGCEKTTVAWHSENRQVSLKRRSARLPAATKAGRKRVDSHYR